MDQMLSDIIERLGHTEHMEILYPSGEEYTYGLEGERQSFKITALFDMPEEQVRNMIIALGLAHNDIAWLCENYLEMYQKYNDMKHALYVVVSNFINDGERSELRLKEALEKLTPPERVENKTVGEKD